MHTCRRFMSYICAGLLTVAAVSGCGGSKKNETIPTTVAIFNAHSLIFRNNTAMTMGYNAFGQLGDNSLENRAVATKVSGLGHMTGGAAGAEHTLAFSNHTSVVMAWGYNAYGQLGNPSISTSSNTAFSKVPVAAQLERPVTGVAAGSFHSLAVANNSVWTWGDNSNGQLGDGDDRPGKSSTPKKLTKDIDDLPLPAKAVQVAGGGLHSLALFDDGSVYAWGSNSYGQTGFSLHSSARRPKKVSLPEVVGRVTQIAAGEVFSLALEEEFVGGDVTAQTLWAWGYGGFGQLGKDPATLSMLTKGDKLTAYSFAPVKVFTVASVGPNTPVIKRISAGFAHVLLLFGNRDSAPGGASWTVQAFGLNFYGQLGNNKLKSPLENETTVSSFELVHTLSSAGNANVFLTGVTDIAAFGHHSLAKANGLWYGWGNNNIGQLGYPVPTSSAGNPKIPVLVQGQ